MVALAEMRSARLRAQGPDRSKVFTWQSNWMISLEHCLCQQNSRRERGRGHGFLRELHAKRVRFKLAVELGPDRPRSVEWAKFGKMMVRLRSEERRVGKE